MTLDLSPAPSATSPGRAALRQGRIEALLQIRHGEQILLSLLIPIAALVLGRFLLADVIDFGALAPSVLALALWSSGFTAVAIATGFERRYGVLERLATTPLQRGGLVRGKVIGVSAIAAIQLIILIGLSLALGWRPTPDVGAVLVMVATSLCAMAAFVSAALLMAGRLRAEVTLAVANVLHLAFSVGGGILIPTDRFPAPADWLVALVPTGALGQAWRQFSTGMETGFAGWLPLVVAAAWAGVLGISARRGFRWLS